MSKAGKISWISGPTVRAEGLEGIKMYEVVYVGYDKLIGEAIAVSGDKAIIQVYENTSGLKPGEPVYKTGEPLSVTLGPGIIGRTYDGVQRPLDIIALKVGYFVKRGVAIDPLPTDKKWFFEPKVKLGEEVTEGDILGFVQETTLIKHAIMVPIGIEGKISYIVKEGEYYITDTIAEVSKNENKYVINLYQKWPVRKPRPYKERLEPEVPLITGQRIIDTLFPIAKGGTGAIPGGFGTGKTVMLHQIAAWCDAKVVIYIGCGERGNEMAEVLVKFPELTDPYSGRPLMERTILIANTSNMPISAREASIYTGISIAEYYRDMGYDVVLVADSTSRWAEALREISGRLEEMPAEEGFPPYLASRLAEFYERAGRVVTLGKEKRIGSVTVIGAVSPPGGDFSEPVTVHTLRFVRTFWGLDSALAYSRHYPAINWIISYSLYVDSVAKWWEKFVGKDWLILRRKIQEILQKEDELKEIVKLLGPEALPDNEKLVLDVARMIREGFLQQNAFDPVDSYCSVEKQYKMLKLFVDFYENAKIALEKNIPLTKIRTLPVIVKLMRCRYTVANDKTDELDKLHQEILDNFNKILSS
ncbi:MAG: V-type ATP synthase subunit A [Thermoproteota archaeon]|nr:V-type ATP synthase subunit A [Thermoproteota archaeon]